MYYLLFIGFFWMVGCSSKTIKIDSVPSGATVFVDAKNIGATPLELSSSSMADQFSKEFLDIRIEKPGYQPRTVLASTRIVQDISLNLEPYTKDYFEKILLSGFQESANDMVKEILTLQALIISKKYDVAETKLAQFIQKYPNVAAPYVLQANLEMSKNNLEQAIKNLERARSLDAEDAVVARMLENLKRSVK